MPRLTNSHYLDIHRKLRTCWLEHQFLFATIEAHEQWDLHSYFKPYAGMPDAELIEHRKAITKQNPGLPQRAGRAFAHLRRNNEAIARPQAQATKPVATTSKQRNSAGPLKVYPLVNPEPDYRQLARAFIRIARGMKEKKIDD